jgi:colanic acid biosynthesis glycosyl transferase WcaI
VSDGYSRFRYTRTQERGVNVTRAPHYVPAHPSGARRILHHLSFAATALIPTLWRALVWRPDVVMTIAPSLIAAPVAYAAAIIAGAPDWLHVQDFEVEAAFATGLMDQTGPLARLGRWFETTMLGRFDVVSTISQQMVTRLKAKGVAEERIYQFPNWSDTETIAPLTQPSSYREEWGITTPHVALYSGNIANKQGIEILLDAAKALSHRKDITFVVCGEGPNRARLETLAKGAGNIQFHDLQPKARLNDLLGLATIHLLPQLADAADLVLPSKLTNMLASGRPVVATAAPGTGIAREVEHCGLITEPGDHAAFASAVATLADNADLYQTYAAAARYRAEERWAKDQVLHGFEHKLSALLTESRDAPLELPK